jgi:hypothetical protein
MMEKRERTGQELAVGLFEAGAADHDVCAVLSGIAPYAVPQQFDRAPGPVSRQNACSANFEKALAGVPLKQVGNVELIRAIESAMYCTYFLRK